MRRFKAPNRDQLMLFPPNLNDWIGDKHPARYVVDFVETLDLKSFYAEYGESGDGQPPYDPKMMLAILLYANMLGISSSRKIERLITDDIGFRFISGHLAPDHDTIADFRQRQAKLLKDVFMGGVRLAVKAGIVGLNHVAVDGTKVRANAAQSAKKTEEQLKQEIRQIEKLVGDYLEDCERVDKQEDQKFGKGNNGYLLPDFLKDEDTRRKWIKEQLAMDTQAQDPAPDDKKSDKPEKPNNSKQNKKLERLRKAKAALEEKERKRKEADPTGKRERDAQRKRGTDYVSRINVTDPDCRTMLFPEGGYREGFNCQIAVDSEAGIIVAADVTQEANDLCQLAPMLLQTQSNTGWLPDNVSADTGYFNIQHLEDPKLKSVEFYVPPKKKGIAENERSKSERMRERLETEVGRALYGGRKGLVEPVFGAIKHARKFRQMLTRGKEMVKAEWHLVCTAHNLLKLYKLAVVPF